MRPRHLQIVHLYPDEMNIYGDRGNIITLVKRLEWRGITAGVQELRPGEDLDLDSTDIVFGGGGQDSGQIVVAGDLMTRRSQLEEAKADGVVMLTVCGSYQLLGMSYLAADGTELPGIGLLCVRTGSGRGRLIGNVEIDTPYGRMVGFENHGGRTQLEPGQEPLGRVVKGFGNNGRSGEEGAVSENVFGTYLHGPVLPRNPRFADELIGRALLRRYGDADLTGLDDSLERAAAATAGSRPR
ncbi:MAG: Cobyric acid synthase [Acidimicrobiales bacterium]|nr:Cobyric acid synthase [Acidimicrobiales bacterium]